MSAGDKLLTDALSGLLREHMPNMRDRGEVLASLVADKIAASVGKPATIEILEKIIAQYRADDWLGPNNR